MYLHMRHDHHYSARLTLRCAVTSIICISLAWAQTPDSSPDNRYQTTAGRHIALPQAGATKDGARAAGTTKPKYKVTSNPPLEFGMSVNWDVDGNGPLLVVPVTTPPGNYEVTITALDPPGEQSKMVLMVQVDPLRPLTSSNGCCAPRFLGQSSELLSCGRLQSKQGLMSLLRALKLEPLDRPLAVVALAKFQ
jgi:hypothetical protein